MPFNRDSLAVLLNRTYAKYQSLFKPLEKSPKYNLLKVFAAVDAGMYHQLLGDITFLEDQLFPDTASGDYLRLHWSDSSAAKRHGGGWDYTNYWGVQRRGSGRIGVFLCRGTTVLFHPVCPYRF